MEKEKRIGVGTPEEFLSTGDFEAKIIPNDIKIADKPLKLKGDELWWSTGQKFPISDCTERKLRDLPLTDDAKLAALIEKCRSLGPMTDKDKREQRISWVYGNCALSNPKVTREMAEAAVDSVFGPLPTGADLSPYINPIASLRSERKIKPGKAAKLLGISRQRLYVVEHAQRELPCMERLLEKAQKVWKE